MKNISLFALLLLTFTGFSQGKWERISSPTSKLMNSVYFTDSLTGWAVGDSGTILHTTDGAKTWTFQESHIQYEIVDLFFLNSQLGWASAFNMSNPPFGTLLLKTTNGGETWNISSFPGEDLFVSCLLFLDSLNGWAGGSPHVLAKTTDGGLTWTEAEVDSSTLAFFPVLNIHFTGKYGYACGGRFDIAGVIWHTDNGGEKWYANDVSEAPADEVHELYLFDSLNVIGAGGDPDFGYGVGMIRTTNGGLHWTYQELGIQGNAYDLDFRTKKEAWAPLGPGRAFVYSLDGGNTWAKQMTPDSMVVNDVIFPDSLHGYAVGRQGVIMKYTPPVTSIAGLISEKNPLIFNYPNPFTSKTTIKVVLPSGIGSSDIKILISDLSGKIVKVLPGIPDSNVLKVEFEKGSLVPGVYLIRCLVEENYLPGVGKMVAIP